MWGKSSKPAREPTSHVFEAGVRHLPGWRKSKGWHSFKSINLLMLIISDFVTRFLVLLRT